MRIYVTKSTLLSCVTIWRNRPAPVFSNKAVIYACGDEKPLVRYLYGWNDIFPNLNVEEGGMRIVDIEETEDGYVVK